MEPGTINKDDVLDVIDLSIAIANQIRETIGENPKFICLSAIINASVLCSVEQCDTINEILLMKNTFSGVFDEAIKKACDDLDV